MTQPKIRDGVIAPTLMLQVNTSGSWRNFLSFEPERREEILGALAPLATIVGKDAKWCLVGVDGKREWLPQVTGPWLPITVEQPPPLVDVMVSAVLSGDDEPTTLMAYRAVDGSRSFYLTGPVVLVISDVYAWMLPHAAAPASMREVSP